MMQSVAQIDPFWMHKACDSLFGREEGIYGFLHVGHSKGTCIVQSQAAGAFDGGRFKFQATSTTESTDATTSDILAKADPTNHPTKLMRSPFSQDTCTRERGHHNQGRVRPTLQLETASTLQLETFGNQLGYCQFVKIRSGYLITLLVLRQDVGSRDPINRPHFDVIEEFFSCTKTLQKTYWKKSRDMLKLL